MKALSIILVRGSAAAYLALAGLCIYGAFAGQERAAEMFNSPPLIAFWIATAAMLLAAVVLDAARRRLTSAIAHLGPLLVLVGAMWSSEPAHRLMGRFGIDKPRRGYLNVLPGHHRTVLRMYSSEPERDPENLEVGKLPFSVQVDSLDLEYYPPAAADDASMQPVAPHDPSRHLKDIACRVTILRGAGAVKNAVVSVNHPLHYGGYHIYLDEPQTLVPGDGRAVFMVQSDSGLWLVYCGFGVMIIGMILKLWLRPRRQMPLQKPL